MSYSVSLIGSKHGSDPDLIAYQLEYIWLDGNQELRSKTKIFRLKHKNDEEETQSSGFFSKSYKSSGKRHQLEIKDIPYWNYDGSSCKQAEGHNSEVILKPVKMISDPFCHYNSYLVLCETYFPTGDPHPTNTRFEAAKLFNVENMEIDNPTFGLEQEFFVFKDGTPVGYVKDNTKEQGEYYCGVGANNVFDLRTLSQSVIDKCLAVNINLTGFNFEVAPGQIEFQLCNNGIEACDQFVLLRYIISRVCESYGCYPNWDPKPEPVDTENWNGSGCHINFSTKAMLDTDDKTIPHKRVVSSWTIINDFLKELGKTHQEHLKCYGQDNHKRLTGKNETSSTEKFTYGVADRGASVRIPSLTLANQKGYIEDRRPGSNIDPYLAIGRVYKTYLEAKDNNQWYL